MASGNTGGVSVDQPMVTRHRATGLAVLCLRQPDEVQIGQLLSVLQSRIYYGANGGDAIAIARNGALSCVITPLVLPDMAAAALIDGLHRVSPGLAVIVIADSPLISETVEVMRCGAHAVIDSRSLSPGLLHQVASLVHGR